jgi:transcriptional regulator with XRE-family HTH domain
MTLRRIIGARVRQARQQAGMSQEQLASAIGSEAATLSRYETARRAIPIETLERIAKALNLPVVELVGAPVAEGRASLRADEREVLSTYRSMSPAFRRLGLRLLRVLRRGD